MCCSDVSIEHVCDVLVAFCSWVVILIVESRFPLMKNSESNMLDN
jgi:hypothetical protein